MLYFAGPVLKENKHKELKKELLLSPDWIDGAATALGTTKQIKKNIQLTYGESHKKCSEFIINVLKNNRLIKNYALPFDIFHLLFSRTGEGMFYGPHVDLGISSDKKRRDFSFTLFLNDKNEYKGGELILHIPPETRSIKLNAGEIIIYPTKYLHEVKKVTEGERLVCVGWIQSQIIRDDDREVFSMFQETYSEVYGNENVSLSTRTKFNSALNRLHKRFTSLS